jgi:hypothetical protein
VVDYPLPPPAGAEALSDLLASATTARFSLRGDVSDVVVVAGPSANEESPPATPERPVPNPIAAPLRK